MAWVLAVLAVYVAVILLTAWISVHPPRTPIFLSPGFLGVPQSNTTFESADGIELRGWWVDVPNAPTVVILLHGYLMTRAELAPVAVRLFQSGCASLLIDFRAHGSSRGKTCGMGYHERQDVHAAIRHAQERYPNARIVLMGSSMGGAASALCQAEWPEADALILDCAYSRLSSAITGWWRFVGGEWLTVLFAPTVLVARPLVGFRVGRIDIAQALAQTTVPVLFLHGERDTLALPVEAQRNIDACGERATVLWLPGSNHAEGRWLHPDLYWNTVLTFLQTHAFVATTTPPLAPAGSDRTPTETAVEPASASHDPGS